MPRPGDETAIVNSAPAFVDHYLAFLLAKASRLISGEFHATLKAQGIPVSEWRILAALRDGPLAVTRLADLILEQQPTASRLVQRMAEAGLVQRRACAEDGRRTLVELTRRGRQRSDDLTALAMRHQEDTLAPFGPERAGELLDTLRDLIRQHDRPA